VRLDAAPPAPRIHGQTPAATLFQKEGQMAIGKQVFLIAVFSMLLMGSAMAQENAELEGTVTDPTGAAVPRAQVTITNTASSEVRTGNTNGDGLYDFPGMRIGTYTLSVTAAGFETYSKTNIVMNVAAAVRENVALAIGASSQTVSVSADALHLQSDTNEVSSLITGEQMTQIATDGRNMVSLATLGTGVSNNLNAFNGISAQTSGFGLSFNGMRPDHNDWLIDGGEAYDRGSGGKFDLMPSPDVLAEFQTLSSNYSPDYGISSGGTIVTVLKSGTNQFHGGLWEFNRNDDFDAVNYFAKDTPGAPVQIPELRLNIFGGEVGGPVFIPKLYPKDRSKTYFFWSEEWRRYITGVNPTQTATVPNADFPTAGQALTYQPWNEPASLANGVCNAGQTAPCVPKTNDPAKLALYAGDGLTPGNAFPGNVIPANLIDPNAVLFMGTGAIPHQTNSSVTAPTVTASPSQPQYVREDVVRADHDISPRLHLMGHWIHDAMVQTIIPSEWSGDSYDTVGTVFANPSWASVIKLSQTLSPTILNETALNVNGNTINWTPTGITAQPAGWSAQPFAGFAGNAALKELPQVGFSGNLGTQWTENYDPWRNAFLDYQVKDDLSWEKGKHGFKFGASYMRVDKNQNQQALVQGQYSFGSDFSGDSYLNFLLGNADSFQQIQQLTTPHWINNTYSFYAMDNWRITPRLTLNLGLRYDLLPHVYEKNNRVANFVPADFNPAEAQTPSATTGSLNPNGPGFQTIDGASFYLNGMEIAGQNGFPRGVVQNDYFTPEPRVGFAYDLFGTGKTILRGGSGIFYERVQGNDVYGLGSNPPFAFQPTANQVNFTNPNQSALTGQSASQPSNPAGPSTLSNYYPNPGTYQYSLGIQQQIEPSVIAVVQYVGSSGWNQSDERGINTLPLADLTDRQAVAAGANQNLYRMFQGYGGITQVESATNTGYNSLQAGLRFTNKHNLTGQLSYTWSHEIDIQSGDLGSTNGSGGQAFVSDPFNLRYDRGSGVLDRRQVFSANYDYRLPFFRTSGLMAARELLGGWELSGVTVAQSGSPQDITYNGPDTLGLGGDTLNRPNLVGNAKGPKTRMEWFNTSAFSAPVAPWNGGPNQGFGSAGKDSVVGPGLFNWDISLFKSLPLTPHEGPRVELRFESYNTFNHTEFQGVDTGFTDANFGQATSAYDPRVLQFGAKFLF
jgi:hypothetical protein